jgi:hypothetical protein
MTPEEIAKVKQETEKLVRGWYQNLSAEEAAAWADAFEEDRLTEIANVEKELAGCRALRWLAKQCPPGTRLLEAVEMIRQKPQRSLAEAEALDAWDRIKNKETVRKK